MLTIPKLQQNVSRWLNRFQLAALHANPRILVVEAGRRSGKTEEILAERFLKSLIMLVGASGFFSGKSFSKLLDHMLPGLIAGWRKRGLVEGEDFVICKTPPRHFKLPLIPPKKWDHYICCSWGSGIHLASMDGNVTTNGLTTDFGALDEAKQQDPVKVQSELLKTMSGHRSMPFNDGSGLIWGDVPEHRMLTILTDKFIGKKDYKWVDQYKKESMTMREFHALLMLADRVQKTQDPYLMMELWDRQKKATMYLEYSSRENLPVIGIEYFRDEFKNSNPIEFRTSILNEDIPMIDGGFYTLLDEDTHTYEARSISRIEAIGIADYLNGKERNCRLDNDVRAELPIKLGVDYGSSYSWFVTAQHYADTYFILNNFWSEEGEHFLRGLDRYIEYYRPHKTKVVELYDDPGGHKKGTDQQRDVEKVIKHLQEAGWKVIHKNPDNRYIPHRVKYRIFQAILNESADRDKKAPHFKINVNNAYQTFYSMSKAPIKITRQQDGFAKDKDKEGKMGKQEWKATHLSDAMDNIICFDNEHLVGEDDGWKVSV